MSSCLHGNDFFICAGSGICGIAVISAIFGQKDIEAATKELRERTQNMLRN